MKGDFVEFKYGWPVVLAGSIGISLGMSPLPFYTIGVFAQPLTQEFGWTIGQVMTGLVPFCIATVFSAIRGLLIGSIRGTPGCLGRSLIFWQ